MTEVFSLALKDFFTKKFLKFSLVPLILSFFLFVILAYFAFNFLFEYFDALFANAEEGSFLAWLYSFAIFQFILALLGIMSASFLVVFASVFFAILVVSFLTPFICKEINAKYYQHELKDEVSFFKALFKMLIIFVKFLLLFGCACLLYLVPFVNLFVFYLVFYYLFHKLLILDVASSMLNDNEFKAFYAKSSALEFKLSTLMFYLISSVPLAGLFLQVFFVIFLTHLFYQKVLGLKANLGSIKEH
ncbi:hypothetical protein DMB95_01955 [Campylobacter sp. MIT 12-8780]|uniref:EI24 domain-containing protein n=1 Tax=unclassified Campylobacter TaxID=2593542 RepID=UPI00115D27FB|nr:MULTISPECIES: EI24 domain-containing protein [unclassified Campylobacter]NDJ26773.1 hypothetical protein [Campylobacter sp. MIT 19-121]TQR42403.1 hypothetical protein DMB95_01955 [Campylobacter sp. MIT 12-8780]